MYEAHSGQDFQIQLPHNYDFIYAGQTEYLLFIKNNEIHKYQIVPDGFEKFLKENAFKKF